MTKVSRIQILGAVCMLTGECNWCQKKTKAQTKFWIIILNLLHLLFPQLLFSCLKFTLNPEVMEAERKISIAPPTGKEWMNAAWRKVSLSSSKITPIRQITHPSWDHARDNQKPSSVSNNIQSAWLLCQDKFSAPSLPEESSIIRDFVPKLWETLMANSLTPSNAWQKSNL